MFCEVWRAAVAIGMAEKTRSGKLAAHCSTCMPPIEPPMTENRLSMPSRSSSIAWARTMSRMVITGRSSA
jgi:hypothetical protein